LISNDYRPEIKPSKLSGPSIQAQLGLIGAQFSLLSGIITGISLSLCAWLSLVECMGLVLGLGSTKLNYVPLLLVLSRTNSVL